MDEGKINVCVCVYIYIYIYIYKNTYILENQITKKVKIFHLLSIVK